ncbi:hypothetical protein [Wolbachia endosymbiont of Chironomus riparius]|uniref:hypothetical protein n=1 Tax=Wolbachia endosymbiont of Chironomus riparius TaxID=2883238 RepID=UPI00209D1ECA|nr:hypothetical protein [Wolbachia endosymbiont of Chironomus riparius]
MSVYKNFNNYTHYGTIPAVRKCDNRKVPQNNFYRSVNYINNVVGPIKDAIFGVGIICAHLSHYTIGNRNLKSSHFHGINQLIIYSSVNISLQVLYLTFAYLSYWPLKGLEKIGKSELFVDYANGLSLKAMDHASKIAEFVNTILSYVCTAVVWTAALIITPLVWSVEKVGNILNQIKEPTLLNNNLGKV